MSMNFSVEAAASAAADDDNDDDESSMIDNNDDKSMMTDFLTVKPSGFSTKNENKDCTIQKTTEQNKLTQQNIIRM